MPQLPLFESREAVLADDATGRIVYTPAFVPEATATSWFRELRDAVTWHSQTRRMYDREVDVPRLTAHFRLDPADGPPPDAILSAARLVAERIAVAYNSVGLNLYRDGGDSVAPHNDHLDELASGYPIALLSLGATRRMSIRAKPPSRRAWDLDLEAGSLLTMSYETQIHYTHGVPKVRGTVGERISLAFRMKAAAPPP